MNYTLRWPSHDNNVQYLRSEWMVEELPLAEGLTEGRTEGLAERRALSGGEAPLSPTQPHPAVWLECRLE